MRRPLPSATLLCLSGLCALAMMLAASAARAADAADELLLAHCATAVNQPPATLDLERAEREAEELQERNDPRANELACQAWVQVHRARGHDHIDAVRWSVNLAIALFTRGRTDDARLVGGRTWQRAMALGPDAAHLARQSASMVSMVHLQRQQMADALLWVERAVATLPPDAPPDRDNVRLRVQHATLLSMERRHDEARAMFAQLLPEVRTRQANLVAETVYVLHQWAVAERRRGDLAEALRLNTENLAFQRQWTPDKVLNIALATHNQGLLLRALARYDEAEALLREALDTSRGATQPDLMQTRASLRDTLASLLVERGRPAEALPLAQEAVHLLAAGPEAGTPAMVRPLRRLAESQAALGDLAAAVQTWRQALVIIDARPDAGDAETRHLARLSYTRLMLTLGNVDEARRTLALADTEAAARPGQPASERAERLILHAQLLLAQGRSDEAMPWLQQADAAWAELHGANHPQRLRLAALACEWGHDCAALARRDTDALPPDVSTVQALALARWARMQPNPGQADEQARRALLAADASANLHLQWLALAEYAQQQADAGRLFEASFFGKRALAVIQSLRDNLQAAGGAADESFVRDKAALYRRVADWLLRQQRIAEALQTLNLLKQHEQADYNERAGTARGTVVLTDAERELQRLLDEATAESRAQAVERQQLIDRQRNQRITAQEQQRLAELQQALVSGQARARQRLDTALAALRSAAAAPSTAAAAQQPLLTTGVAGELQAWLMLTERELVLVFASGGRQWVQRRGLDGATPLVADIAALLDRLQQRQPAHELQRTLYERVARPLDEAARAAGARRVRVWLDGALRYLPLSALHDGQRHLGEKLVLRSSAAGAATVAARPGNAAARLRAFGVTRAHAGLPALPAVADELCGIVNGPVNGLNAAGAGCTAGAQPRGHGPLPGQADADQRFTEAALHNASRQATLLHIGTHFVLRPGSVAQSWLLLGDGQRLPLQRLQALDLGAPALVTLSACDTAIPVTGSDGREIDGLAATWLGKGAGQVLASLWRVDDRDTAGFMRRFYAELARSPGDAALALQRTQHAAAASGQAPWHWAAFTLLVRP